MQGVVQATEFTKKGAKKFQISGQWYYAGRCKTDGLDVGSAIEFNFAEFGEDQGRGRLKGLEWWKPVQGFPSEQQVASGFVARPTSPSAPQTPQKPHERVSTLVTITEVDVLRSVSNVVGSACAAGTVKSPEELEKWFVAAWSGLLRRDPPPTKERIPGADDDFNDELPQSFYQRPDPSTF